jgi:hypothetical protein
MTNESLMSYALNIDPTSTDLDDGSIRF